MRGKKSALLGIALGVAVLGLTACEDKTTVDIPPEEPPPLQIGVTPAAITLNVDDVAQVVAQVTGGAAGADKSVSWASSNTGVASVSANGNVATVTGVSAGVATITATANADANVKAAAAVTVTAGPVVVPPTISIKSITTGATNIPVNINNVFGQVEITMNLDVPPGAQVSRVELLANGQEIYHQDFNGEAAISFDEAQSAVDLIASWNTADFTPNLAVGNVQGNWMNGSTDITAQVIGSQGTITASTSTTIVLNNRAFIYADLTSPSRALGGTPPDCVLSGGGIMWCTGDIVVQAQGVRFDDNANNALTQIALAETFTAKSMTDSDGSDGFSMTLQKSGGSSSSRISGVEVAGLGLTLNALTVGGQVGPNCVVAAGSPTHLNLGCVVLGQAIPMANPLNHDNVPPDVTLFDLTPATLGCAPATACYVSGNPKTPAFEYKVTSSFFKHDDTNPGAPYKTTSGVGVKGATFEVGESGNLMEVTSAEQLAESVVPNYITKATSCDLLDNCDVWYAGPVATSPLSSTTGAQLHGVDSTQPTASVSGLANNSTNPAPASPAWTISFSDGGVGPSGFSSDPVRVNVFSEVPSGRTCYNGDNPVPATMSCTSQGSTVYDADDGQIDIIFGTEAYWGIDFFVLDQAGNFSEPNGSRLTLIDVTSPLMAGIAHPSEMVGGTSFSITELITDNVDLERYVPWFTYSVSLEGPRKTVGAYGIADGLVGSTTASYDVQFFVRATENTNASGRVVAGPSIMSTVWFQAWDVAGNSATQGWGVSPAVLAPVGGTMPSLTTIAPTIFAPANPAHGNFVHQAPSEATVCSGTSSQCGSTPPASTVLSATMTGPNSTFANPFTYVHFYYQDPASGRWVFIGTGAASASDDSVTSTRTWTYSVTWTVTGLEDNNGNQLLGVVNVLAVGVHSSGSAAITNVGTPQSVTVTAT